MHRPATRDLFEPPARPARGGHWLRASAACLGIFGAASVGAQGAAAASAYTGIGPWLFATVTLLLVAAMAWLLGRATGRREAKERERQRTQKAGPAKNGAPGGPVSPEGKPASVHAAYAPPPEDAAAVSYALSHDLRAPLRVVQGFAAILKEDYGRQLDRIGNDHLDRLMTAALRMGVMIDGMMTLTQMSSKPLARQPVNVSRLALEIINELRHSQPRPDVVVQVAPDLHATGDPILLRRLLENLLSNAWKYSSKTAQARISLRVVDKAGQRAFEVADNGAGFDMRSAKRLFGMFQRLHGNMDFPGIGLGLASVKRIVDLHGGKVWAEGEPDRGARFYFTLQG